MQETSRGLGDNLIISINTIFYDISNKKVLQNVNVFGEIVLCTKILPIVLALCLMLLPSYYAQNYAGIIGSSLSSMAAIQGVAFNQVNMVLLAWL